MRYFKVIFIPLIVLIAFYDLKGQIINGKDTLYGHEWINYDQTYFKINISNDGIYRLPFSLLQNSGIPLSIIKGSQFRLYRMGKEIPIYTSNPDVFSNTDFIEFYAVKNKSELDSYMFKDGEKAILNPDFSLITDTISYFLTWVNDNSIGRRIEKYNNNLSNLPSKEAWFWYYDRQNFNQQDAQYRYGDVYISEFSKGEGYGSSWSKNFSLNISPQYRVNTEGGELLIRWTNQQFHISKIALDNALLDQDTVSSFTLNEKNIPLNSSQMKSTMNIALSGNYSDIDRVSVGIVQLKYARQFNFGNAAYFEFNIQSSDLPKYLEIENFNTSNTAPILYDITNNLRIETTVENSIVKVLIPPSVSNRQLVLFNAQTGFQTVNTLIQPSFKNFKKIDADYIIITSDKFIKDGIANEYAQYRQSLAGGSFKTSVINIQEIYDNFVYGIQRHPIAIRDFAHFIKKYWTNPQYIVLMGKAREFNAIRTSTQLTAQISTYDIPTWGYPGSDILMVASQSSDKPVIPIGRIAASSPTDVKNYLDKIKELEYVQKNAAQTVIERDFLKNMLHLSGGGSVGIPIKNQLKDYENILSKGKFGAAVSTFYKNSVDPVEIAQNDKIFERINKGLSLITFFGHSATSVLEFDVNNPNLLNNKSKTPTFIALGCSAGNVHQSSIGVSENFIFYPNKGMSAFIGTSGTSYLSSLSNIGTILYDLIANEYYGESIGKIIQKAIEKTGNNVTPDIHSAMQSFIINGDPALKIATAPSPDYIVDATTVKINPSLVTAQTDSISLQFELVNIGTAVTDSIKIAIQQLSPDATISLLKNIKIATPQYRSLISTNILLAKRESIGINRLLITIDIDNKITELPSPKAEANNELLDASGKRGFEFLILANNIIPVYPPQFSIVGKTPLILKASTSNPLATAQNYFFELDTTRLFNSPLKQTATINSKGGVLKWQPSITYQDSIVYYWRTAIEPINNQPINWQNSSFTYITGKSGWAQGHFYQFTQNQLTDMVMNEGTREMEYVEDDLLVSIKGSPDDPRRYPYFFINSVLQNSNPLYFVNKKTGFFITVFDFSEGNSWVNLPNKPIGNGTGYGFLVPYRGDAITEITFNFDSQSQEPIIGRHGAIDFIEKIIPDKSYVMFFAGIQDSRFKMNAKEWLSDSITKGKNIFQVLEMQGANHVRSLITKDSVNYYIFFQKNASKIIKEKIQNSYDEGLNDDIKIPRRWYTGSQTTPLLGPSKKWENLDLNYTTGLGDTLGIDILGVDNNKKETLLKSNITTTTTNLSDINALEYPYLKLKYQSRDIRQQTPPQLKSWRVYYQGQPDWAINPLVHYSFKRDTLQQGDTFRLSVGIENVSDYNADSVTVAMTLKNEQNQSIGLKTILPPLAAGQSQIAPFEYTTRNMEGKQQAAIEVNPSPSQAESFTGNNYLSTSFNVLKDKTNPLLEVTFDGQKILNNDIVSSKPLIQIRLKDENPFLALNDTGLFKLVLEPVAPTSGISRTIYFNDPTLKFTPSNQTATIEYRPDFLKDGTYRLVVSSKDASGNRAGTTDYSIQFKVITQQSISQLLPYPNPFSTATRFAYTLTGDTPPQYISIQIMTLSGKIVREITQNELGSLKIGTHLTDYYWDGRDEYGSLLANGVYFYKVIIKDKNKQLLTSSSENTLNTYFKNNIGKIVIMR